jgi:copper chaperone
MPFSIQVDNIKCGGCANSINSGLEPDARVRSVTVRVVERLVEVDGDDALGPILAAELAQIGYPEVDSVEGATRVTAKAKSFVSCAIGRMN